MPHGRHIYAKASGMVQATMCTYTQSDHALPHWKCVLRCCADYPCINIPDQEIYINTGSMSQTPQNDRFLLLKKSRPTKRTSARGYIII